MLLLSAVFVAISIGLGIYMVLRIAQKQTYAKRFVLAHVATVGTGAILVVICALSGSAYLWPNISLAVVVALLGCTVSFYKFKNRPNRMVILTIHAILALICYSLLLLNTFIIAPAI